MPRTLLSVCSIPLVAGLLFSVACSRYGVIPASLERRVNRSATYEQVHASPETYRGEMVVWGGKVLKVQRHEDRTHVDVLALPLTRDLLPKADESKSPGRFAAFDSGKEILKGTDLEPGTFVTVVGEVAGLVRPENPAERVPALQLRDLTKWTKTDRRPWGHAFPDAAGSYWGGSRPFAFY